MKLAFLTSWYPPPLEGGSVVYLFNLISNLPPEDVLVVTNARLGQDPFDRAQSYRIWRSGTLIRDFRKLGKIAIITEWLARFSWKLREERVDLVHVGDLFLAGAVSWVIYRLWGIPYVVHVYAEELTCELSSEEGFWKSVRGTVYQNVLNDAAGIVGVSDYTLSLLPNFGVTQDKAQIKIIPMVAPAPKVPVKEIDALRKKLGVSDEKYVVLTVGRLIERKGQDNLIRAHARLLENINNVCLVIVGRGPDESRLRALVDELGLGRSVVFAGFVPDPELPVFFEMCDVFAMPHRELPNGDTEGCPTVFLEAGAYGKPVVGGIAGGVRDAILDGETGLLVDGDSVDDIAAALNDLLSDKGKAERLGRRGRQRAIEELSPRRGSEKLLNFSLRILQEKKST